MFQCFSKSTQHIETYTFNFHLYTTAFKSIMLLRFNKEYFFFENSSNFDKIIKFKSKLNRFSKIKFNRLSSLFFQSITNFIVSL